MRGWALLRLLAVLALAVLVGPPTPSVLADRGTLPASVRVVDPPGSVYAASVQACSRCLRAAAATGAPDGKSALLFHNGEITLAFAGPPVARGRVIVWASAIGWGPSAYRVLVSTDGKHWREAGRWGLDGQTAPGIFDGEFGVVRYLKVVRGGWALGAVLLDAVRLEGGEAIP